MSTLETVPNFGENLREVIVLDEFDDDVETNPTSSEKEVIIIDDDDDTDDLQHGTNQSLGMEAPLQINTVAHVVSLPDIGQLVLDPVDFPIGSQCNAKAARAKAWDVAVIDGYNSDKTEIFVHWLLSRMPAKLPFNSECIESLDTHRSRKKKINLFEEEQNLRVLFGMRKLKVKIDNPIGTVTKKVKVESTSELLNMKPPKSVYTTTIEEVRVSETITDKSLSVYAEQFKLFVSHKVYDRLKAIAPLSASSNSVTSSSSSSIVEKILTQPASIVNVEMRGYQLIGMSWLVTQYDHAINSILADEMGLGKTLQTISFLSYLTHIKKVTGPHLVVVPLSVMFNWMAECRKFCPTLRLLRLHGNSSNEVDNMKKAVTNCTEYDVCITSYEMIKGALENTLQHMVWRTVVLDEGHRIKNVDAQVSKSCLKLRSRFKLILTGTPVQNNLRETWCLLHFLFPRIFEEESSEIFKTCFEMNSAAIQIDRDVLDAAHYLMRPFVLRRLKSEVEQKLPPKLETMIRCPISDMQRFWIRRLLIRDSSSIINAAGPAQDNSSANSNGTGSNVGSSAMRAVTPTIPPVAMQESKANAWKKLQSLLAQLRKASNHPYLFPGAEDVPFPGAPCGEDIVTASGKMVVLDKLLKKLQAKGHRVVIFSQYTQTLDIINDYLDLRGFNHCRLDGSTNRVMREVLINQFNRRNSPLFIFCLSTRAGGEGVNLFTADTVILFDSDWNPQKDIQAMARVHRIGQTKPVHIYRLVSEGTVEERIVQRAQKKLFLDSMINRGSTLKSMEIDEQLENQKMTRKCTAANGTTEEEDAVDVSTMMSALKFGWNACFNGNKTKNEFLSNADLEAIIDRTRGLNGKSAEYSTTNANSSSSETVEMGSVQLTEGLENSVEDFDETVPFTSLRLFEGEELKRCASSSIGDISKEWIQTNARNRVSRLEQVKVTNVGLVSILKSNNYSLEAGEPSVFDKESKGYREYFSEPKRKRSVYDNQDYCQICWTYGSLICCQLCPTSYHKQCVGLKSVPLNAWKCPHHEGCGQCSKSMSAVGFLFRCELCSNAYCEDCLPVEAEMLGECRRFTDLGYKQPSNACYIHCGRSCIKFAAEQEAHAINMQLENKNALRVEVAHYSTVNNSNNKVGADQEQSVKKKRKPYKKRAPKK